jgi:hypothetical protein
MSGDTAEAIVQHAVINPGIAFRHKPFPSETLDRTIRDVLDWWISGETQQANSHPTRPTGGSES